MVKTKLATTVASVLEETPAGAGAAAVADFLGEKAAREQVKDRAVQLSEVPEALRPLVESGAIGASWDVVTAEVKGKDDKAARVYLRLDAQTIEGALALNGGRMTKVAAVEGNEAQRGNGVLDYHNYGYDLGVRSNERNRLLSSLEGPEKAIERGVKGLIAAGIPESIARGIVIEQRKLQGLPV